MAELASIGIKNVTLESLVFENCKRLERLWLDDVQAGNIVIGKVNSGIKNVTIENCVVSRLNTTDASLIIQALSITSSTLKHLEVSPFAAFARADHQRDDRKFLDLSGTTYSTVKCEVLALTNFWKEQAKLSVGSKIQSYEYPYIENVETLTGSRLSVVSDAHSRAIDRRKKLAEGLRPSLAVLESALRVSGYDDWADEVYIAFRNSTTRDATRSQRRRNFLSRWLTGYGLALRYPLLVLLLPVIIVMFLVCCFPQAVIYKTPLPVSAAAAYENRSWMQRFPEDMDLTVRTYIPGGLDSQTVMFSNRCTLFCWSLLGDALRVMGWVSLTIFVGTLGSILRYAPRGRDG